MATTADQEKWFSTAVGRGMNPDGMYGYQCKDVVDDMCVFLWGNWQNTITPGDAWQIYPKANRTYFDALPAGATMQRGDVVDWNQNMGGGAGHIAVVTEPLGTGFRVLEQNGLLVRYDTYGNVIDPGKPAYVATYSNRSNIIGILRPKLTQSGGNVSQYTTTADDAKAVFTYWLGDSTSGRWNEWVGQPLDVTVKLVSTSQEAQNYAATRNAYPTRVVDLESQLAAAQASQGSDTKYKDLQSAVKTIKELLK